MTVYVYVQYVQYGVGSPWAFSSSYLIAIVKTNSANTKQPVYHTTSLYFSSIKQAI